MLQISLLRENEFFQNTQYDPYGDNTPCAVKTCAQGNVSENDDVQIHPRCPFRFIHHGNPAGRRAGPTVLTAYAAVLASFYDLPFIVMRPIQPTCQTVSTHAFGISGPAPDATRDKTTMQHIPLRDMQRYRWHAGLSIVLRRVRHCNGQFIAIVNTCRIFGNEPKNVTVLYGCAGRRIRQR